MNGPQSCTGQLRSLKADNEVESQIRTPSNGIRFDSPDACNVRAKRYRSSSLVENPAQALINQTDEMNLAGNAGRRHHKSLERDCDISSPQEVHRSSQLRGINTVDLRGCQFSNQVRCNSCDLHNCELHLFICPQRLKQIAEAIASGYQISNLNGRHIPQVQLKTRRAMLVLNFDS